ncbi:4-hydroxy-tetrahydrodipicolinate synthase [Desemzia sp. RIT804]|uniref:4-hydroxy-tetrahydrodipicolinate synthase n=1 Tax=Desemzia sp. RIT 804 TaxID=2810209 RepID=UPI00194E5C1F|nr:4-hydroxy-tetrahydrodipicolinate synthase [Desemzia sp. RIT 804]MBM6613631.1 4-hydroxy-tetrahydrodipicolinate synthase [Desemzia sp. RIT 804]
MDIQQARVITAMVTPFDQENKVDNEKLKKLIEYLISTGTEGIVVGGTTGESPTLSHDEKLGLYQKTVEYVAGRVPIIAGTGSNNTAETISFTQEVEKISGIDAALVVTPYYNKPNQVGLFAHFEAVAKSTTLPIIVYNVPGRTSVSIDPETTIRLSAIDNLIGIKECAGLDAMSYIISHTPEDFLVYTGEDNLSLPAKAIGANGVISVASQVFGKEMTDMYDALENGQMKTAAEISADLLPKMDSLFSVPSPAPTKFLLNHSGVDVGGLRLPLVDCTREEKERILTICNL